MDKPTMKKESAKEAIKIIILFPLIIISLFMMGFMLFGTILTIIFGTITTLIIEKKSIRQSWKESTQETIRILKELISGEEQK